MGTDKNPLLLKLPLHCTGVLDILVTLAAVFIFAAF